MPQYTFILLPHFSFGKIFLSFVVASIVHLSPRTVWLIFLKAAVLALLYFALVVRDQLLFCCSFSDTILHSLFDLLWNVSVHLCTIHNSWKNLFEIVTQFISKEEKCMCIFFLKIEYRYCTKMYTKIIFSLSDMWPMETHRQKKVQTQDGTELLQIKKLFKTWLP